MIPMKATLRCEDYSEREVMVCSEPFLNCNGVPMLLCVPLKKVKGEASRRFLIVSPLRLRDPAPIHFEGELQ